MNSAQIIAPIMRIVRPIVPHITFIVILAYLVAIGAALWATQSVLSKPSDVEYRTKQKLKFTQSSFDQDAIDKVTALRDDLSNSDLNVTSERSTPFQ